MKHRVIRFPNPESDAMDALMARMSARPPTAAQVGTMLALALVARYPASDFTYGLDSIRLYWPDNHRVCVRSDGSIYS